MRDSSTIAGVLRRFARAFAEADRETMDSLLSDQAGLVVIGSHGQWLTDRDVVLAAFAAEAVATRPSIVVDEGGVACEDGDVAWAAEQLTWSYPDGRTLAYRWTVVLHRSHDRWRIVQSHLSAPEPG